MVEFKTWKDAYVFLKKYGNFTCLNCEHSSHNIDTDAKHTDSEYVHLFCKEWVSMVRLDFQFVCSRWKHQDDGSALKDYVDCDMWNLSDEVLDVIDDGKKWSIKEIEEEIAKQES